MKFGFSTKKISNEKRVLEREAINKKAEESKQFDNYSKLKIYIEGKLKENPELNNLTNNVNIKNYYKLYLELISDKQFSNFDDEINIGNSDKKIYIKYGKLFQLISDYEGDTDYKLEKSLNKFSIKICNYIFDDNKEIKKFRKIEYLHNLNLDRNKLENKDDYTQMNYYYTDSSLFNRHLNKQPINIKLMKLLRINIK